jgi:hypothetical protein
MMNSEPLRHVKAKLAYIRSRDELITARIGALLESKEHIDRCLASTKAKEQRMGEAMLMAEMRLTALETFLCKRKRD